MIDVKKVVIGVVLLIVAIILIFLIVGNSAGDLIDAADTITEANNCSLGEGNDGVAFTYNATDKSCYNSTPAQAAQYVALQYDLPLNTLFGKSSILMLIFMAVILIISITIVIKGVKKK